jgi:hypothetical protein
MRKEKDVTIGPDTAPSEEGRDYGKVFHITEMSAFAADEWSNRAALALLPRLTREVPEDVVQQMSDNPNMATVERIGLILGNISFPDTRELLKELMDCVKIVPDPNNPNPRPIGMAGSVDIEDVETIHFLRKEAMALHTGFTLAASLFNLLSRVSRIAAFNDT